MNRPIAVSRRLKSSTVIDEWLRTGMTIEFLGTSSARPTRTRNVSSLILHHEKTSLMFDCGDGTLRQLINSPISRPNRVSSVFITHLHCDHYYGLPAVGVCLTESGDEELTEAQRAQNLIKLYSPMGMSKRFGGNNLQRYYKLHEFGHYKMVSTGKNYDNSLPFSEHVIYEDEMVKIGAFFIQHSIQSAGYIVQERPTINLNVQKLTEKYALPPGILYGQLLREKNITFKGQTIKLEEVSVETPGRTIAILGDTCNPQAITPYIMDCDVLVHEATGASSDRDSILRSFHSTGQMAGSFAKSVRAKHLILNHFPPRNTLNNVPCDENTYQRQIVKEAKEAAGSEVLVTASYDHLAIPIPKRFAKESLEGMMKNS